MYNVASEDWLSVYDVVNIIIEELGLNEIKVIHKQYYMESVGLET
ncbi:hypothetical protein [Thermofilum sp.]